ncbi:MAG: DUF1853 family protein [Verrucomicrobiales bacterium]|nr:DUF1853 family protein [Verrucomicrobiales bacterium]
MNAEDVNNDQLLADLDWILTCPSLCLDERVAALSDITDAGASADLNPVREFLDSNAWHRVGYYFESFIESLLRGSRQIENLRHSIQVFEGKQTLGELDFIFDHPDSGTTHLEVALKYYLYFEPEHASGSHFMGPNATDNFEKKWAKLANKQLPFGGRHFPEIDQSVAITKGQIFYHPNGEAPPSLPEPMNPNHRKGIWIRESELDWFSQFGIEAAGAILQKPFWLGAPRQGIAIPALVDEIESHFAERKHPLLVSVIHVEGKSVRELERLFVVSDQWPDEKIAR